MAGSPAFYHSQTNDVADGVVEINNGIGTRRVVCTPMEPAFSQDQSLKHAGNMPPSIPHSAPEPASNSFESLQFTEFDLTSQESQGVVSDE